MVEVFRGSSPSTENAQTGGINVLRGGNTPAALDEYVGNIHVMRGNMGKPQGDELKDAFRKDISNLQQLATQDPNKAIQTLQQSMDSFVGFYGQGEFDKQMLGLQRLSQKQLDTATKELSTFNSKLEKGESLGILDVPTSDAGKKLKSYSEQLDNMDLQGLQATAAQSEDVSLARFASSRLALISKDPVGYLKSQGTVFNPVSVLDPTSLQKRFQQLEQASVQRGIDQRAQPLDSKELSNLKDVLAKQTNPELADGILQSMTKGLQDKGDKLLFLGQVASEDKTGAAFRNMLGVLSPKVAADVNAGTKILQKGKTAPQSSKAAKTQIDTLYPLLPSNERKQITDAFLKWSAAHDKAFPSSKDAMEFIGAVDHDIFGKVIPPVPMDKGKLQAALDLISTNDAELIKRGNGVPVHMRGAKNEMINLSDGNYELAPTDEFGKYQVIRNGAPVGSAMFRDKNKEPVQAYIIDIRDLLLND